MKRTCNLMLLAGLAALALSVALPVAGLAMDADELIAKALEAQGGAARLKAVQSQKAVGKFMTQGMEFPFTMIQKRPRMLRVEASVMGMDMIQAYDGETAWSINPMMGSSDPQPMGEMEAKGFGLQADMDGLLMDYAAKGYTVEYLGEEDVEGTPAYKLRVDTGLDIVNDLYFDKEYFLVIKMDTKMTYEGNEITTQMYPSDYRDVDGFMVAFTTETRQGDAVMHQIVMESLEYGVDIDDAVFMMPAQADAAEPPAKPGTPDK